jgi:hypothetical protein
MTPIGEYLWWHAGLFGACCQAILVRRRIEGGLAIVFAYPVFVVLTFTCATIAGAIVSLIDSPSGMSLLGGAVRGFAGAGYVLPIILGGALVAPVGASMTEIVRRSFGFWSAGRLVSSAEPPQHAQFGLCDLLASVALIGVFTSLLRYLMRSS